MYLSRQSKKTNGCQLWCTEFRHCIADAVLMQIRDALVHSSHLIIASGAEEVLQASALQVNHCSAVAVAALVFCIF